MTSNHRLPHKEAMVCFTREVGATLHDAIAPSLCNARCKRQQYGQEHTHTWKVEGDTDPDALGEVGGADIRHLTALAAHPHTLAQRKRHSRPNHQ